MGRKQVSALRSRVSISGERRADLLARARHEGAQRRAGGEVLDPRPEPLVAEHRLVARALGEGVVPARSSCTKASRPLDHLDAQLLVGPLPGMGALTAHPVRRAPS